MSSPEFEGLEFRSVTRIATDTHRFPLPFQLALLEGYPDAIAPEEALKIDGEIVDIPDEVATRIHNGIVRAAALEACDFRVDCINFGALVAGELEDRSDLDDVIGLAADDPEGVTSYVEHRRLKAEETGEFELFTYGNRRGSRFDGEHVSVFLPVNAVRKQLVLSKFGYGNWIGITDLRTPEQVYGAPDLALIEGLTVAYRGETMIRYERQ